MRAVARIGQAMRLRRAEMPKSILKDRRSPLKPAGCCPGLILVQLDQGLQQHPAGFIPAEILSVRFAVQPFASPAPAALRKAPAGSTIQWSFIRSFSVSSS